MHPIAAASDDKDHFGDLTDDLLWHVLSFLTPDEALQTCVLDSRWRDLWRRTKNLDLIFDDEKSTLPSGNIEMLGKLIMQIRGNSPLVKCEIHACPDDKNLGLPHWTFANTKLLIQYAITCHINELIVRNDDDGLDDPLIFDAPYISLHLKTIVLDSLILEHSALDFSGCSALEDLSMLQCCIHVHKISSKSLKQLCITGCIVPNDYHIRICAPSLISLRLDNFKGLTPFLEYMPFLVTAYVGLHYACEDSCDRHGEDCDGCKAHLVKESVLLNGLSNAVHLELIAEPKMFIYRQDLKWCPIFDKLKNLLLNEWFTAIDLVCILQHSPALVMLTLQLGNTKKLLKASEAQETTKQPFVCAHLKVVNIECRKVDERIHKILKILWTCGVLRDHISIKEQHYFSQRFSFQKRPLLNSY